METEEDSIDLNSLKQFALGFVNEPSRLSANCLTPSDRQTAASHKSHGPGGNGRPSSLKSALAISGDTVGVTINPPPPLLPQAHNDAIKMTEGVHSQTATWNVVPRAQSQQMSHPSSQSGDTQPISQSVYDSILRKSDTTRDETRDLHNFEVEYTEVGITQKTLNEGDTGHLDLLAEFDETDRIRRNDSDAENGDHDPDADEIGNSSPTHYEPFPESQRFLNRTPATFRNTASTENRDTTTTPSLSRNPFPDENKSPSTVMALSQLFNATQAPSSSVARVPRPELSSDMPSPNIPIQRRFAAAAMSSPLQMVSSVVRPQYAEPQTSYVSLKESQAAREKLVQPTAGDDQDKASDDGFEKDDSMLQRWVRQKATEDELGRQFATITAPARAEAHGQMARAASLSPTLGREPANLGEKVPPKSFHGQGTRQGTVTANGNGGDSEEETEQEEETHVPNTQGSQRFQSTGEEDKENFDSGPIQVLRTAARAHDALTQALDMEERTSTRDDAFADVPKSPDVNPVSEKLPETVGGAENEARVISSHPDRVSDSQLGGDLQMSNAISQDLGTMVPGRGEDVSPSPSPKSVIRSSPPLRPLNPDIQDERAIQDYKTNVDDIEPSPTQAARWHDVPGNADQTSGKAILETPAPKINLDPPMGNDNKRSSFSSRVYETPAQTFQQTEDQQKTIPETSPTAQGTLFQSTHRGSLSNHDDRASPNNGEVDLPPIPRRSAAGHRMHRHPSDITKRNLSDPISAILSSPSGRQRRSMTEIATDLSPRPAFPEVSIDELGFITAEDKKFQALVAESENYPVKKRRTNDGRSIRASVQSRKPIRSNLFAAAATNEKVDTHQAKVDQKSSDKHEYSTPQQSSQRSNETQSAAEAEQGPRNPDGSKKRTRQQVAYAVVIKTPSHSSPSEAKAPRRDSPDPLQPDDNAITQSPKKPVGQLVAPNRVLAFFNGRPQGYFPATCVGISPGTGRFRYLIQFEDSDTPDEIEPNNLKRLEVRVKDLVKVYHPNIPRGPFVVTGFADKLELTAPGEKNETAPMTDIHGYKSLIVRRRQQQNSPRGQESGTITVPLSSIYFDKALWSKIGTRPFTYVPEANTSDPGIHTSSNRGRVPVPLITRTSRGTSEIDGLFSNMAFAVSGNDKEELSHIETLITRNGGWILDEGFGQLFEPPFVTSPPGSTGNNAASAGKLSCNGTELKLDRKAEQTGFVCLITDECSRRYKYLQALALNLPCLAGRWVRDCVAKKKLVDWEVYLLAAGASSLLGDAFRSRILAPNPPATARLAETVAARPKLLAGQSVLLIMSSGKVAKQREPYASLIYFLGPERVSHVQELETAMDMLKDDKSHSAGRGWDWIYVGNEKAAETARTSLMESMSKSTTVRKRGRPKKRRRAGTAEGVSTGDIVINERKVRILDNEFLCQSLILGRLLD